MSLNTIVGIRHMQAYELDDGLIIIVSIAKEA